MKKEILNEIRLSFHLGICLKSMLHSAKNKSTYEIKFDPNKNDFYVIDSNDPIIDFVNMSNAMPYSCCKLIKPYDFSTLYTSIPHHQLKYNMTNFVDRVLSLKKKIL